LATVAAAAVAGFTTMAAAQATMDSKGAAKPAGAAEDQKAAPGGAMQKPSGAMAPAHSAQGADQAAKPDQRLGQEQKTGAPPQRGAQEERSTTQQKGAQQEHTAPQKGAEQDSGKSGVNASEQHANQSPNKSQGARGASVQLSQDQRSKIGGIIGHNTSARVTTNVNFNVAVGVRIPRDVHVEVLPEDVVEIVPQYEGYDYIVVGDQILIVDPDSLAIIAIIES
jgi:hypothetical protein